MNKIYLRNYYIDKIKNRDELIIMLNKELNDIKIKLSKYEKQIPSILAKKIENNSFFIANLQFILNIYDFSVSQNSFRLFSI